MQGNIGKRPYICTHQKSHHLNAKDYKVRTENRAHSKAKVYIKAGDRPQ